MKLFISYARVDQHYCLQIIDALDVHEVWYDRRLQAGQSWWDEILKRLDWCDGLAYLLSPDSVTSKYCQKEALIAQSLGKFIFPILIHRETEIPDFLKYIQYIDLTDGLSVKTVKELLNSIYIAERERTPANTDAKTTALPDELIVKPGATFATIIGEVAAALDNNQFDRAVFLLKQAKSDGLESRFIDLDHILKKAEAALEKQMHLREAEREYRPIADMVHHKRTRSLGCQAFDNFRNDYPHYDPDNLMSICEPMTLELLEWVTIPAGQTTIIGSEQSKAINVPQFQISKYPVTNTQFQAFVDAPDGYHSPAWWQFSIAVQQWHALHPQPVKPRFPKKHFPRGYITWYEAFAFCLWLSSKVGHTIRLAEEHQWQRAAKGDTNHRYPWGDDFDISKANTRETQLGTPTPVTTYSGGCSPYGVYDMSGNVWEWCQTVNKTNLEGGKSFSSQMTTQPVRGGSFVSPSYRSRIDSRFYLRPEYRYASIGFRLVKP